MPRFIKFQVTVWDHVFEDLVHLGNLNHRTYRQQANYFLERAVKEALHDAEESLDEFLEAHHAAAP